MKEQKELVFLTDVTIIYILPCQKLFNQMNFLCYVQNLLSTRALLSVPVKVLALSLLKIDNTQPIQMEWEAGLSLL